ncbi:MerR family transcriptional regulator [Acinetobacter sp. Marseille-Q1618]|uniref:MerR family transcriptional regulator n=1 Tax=Acinetobacter sp. Marseille-Q1618 TaxID=2697502 RepID=UPI00156DB48D|nr:MerR family transcriptional regulator [Acinetobacter sp. Marseille-Q1618]
MYLAKVAKLTQISPRMLRYYEEQGLIFPKRTAKNYRIYNTSDVQTILKIKVLNDAGITLDDIRVLLPCFDIEQQNFLLCPVVKAKLEQEIEKLTQQLARLTHSHTLLISFLEKSNPLSS